MVAVELDIELNFLEMLARRRGHSTIAEYIDALIDKDDDLMWDEQFAATTPEQWERIVSSHFGRGETEAGESG